MIGSMRSYFLFYIFDDNGGWERHYKYIVLLPKLFLRLFYLFILKIQIFGESL